MLFLGLLMLCSNSMSSAMSLEAGKNRIVATLRNEQPAIVAEFVNFCRQYDALVVDFFDTKNNESLGVHIGRMEAELQTLYRVCHDMRYQSVKGLLLYYYTHIAELVSLLKQYVGSYNTLSLGLKLRKFKLLLPESVKARGDFSLFCSVRHRLLLARDL
jgi:hypothetical protein